MTVAVALSARIAGASAGPVEHAIDARWLMAYAAGVGEVDARWYDTARPGGPVAHPVFPVSYEWPAAVALRERVIGAAVGRRGVHLTHHLVIHRPPRDGDVLRTTARVESVARRPAGALVAVRFETVDPAGAPVTTTRHGTLYRDVDVADDERDVTPEAHGAPAAGADLAGRPDGSRAAGRAPAGAPGPRADAAPGVAAARWEVPVPVPAHAAHVYTECARIWNPIHTDVALARAAGLPGLILHGTATLALAVSRVIAAELAGDSGRVSQVVARFSGMVSLPSTLLVRGLAASPDRLLFDVRDGAGRPVLSEGALCLSPA